MKSKFEVSATYKTILDFPHDTIQSTLKPVISTFPGGEMHVKFQPLNKRPHYFQIKTLIRDAEGIIILLMINDALRNMEPDVPVYLNLGYIPYARQDRIMEQGEAFSLKVFASLINSCGFKKVYVDDPHSDVAPALINNVDVNPQWDIFADYVNQHHEIRQYLTNWWVPVCPDGGALKKFIKCVTPKGFSENQCAFGLKQRDVKTGKILSTGIYGNIHAIHGSNCLIIDDICDGGATFIALAKVLKEKGAKKIGLYVTHGIFSKGKDVLVEAGISDIFTPNDWTIQTGE